MNLNPYLKLSRKVPDSFKAFLLQDAEFTSNEEYPIIPANFVPDEIPKKIMPFDKAIKYHGNLSDTYICFYCQDGSFERIRRTPRQYLKFFKRTAGIIGFDFSVHSDMPLYMQKSQMADNLALTYYYGNNDIKVIPNLRCGIDELIPEFMEAIPKNKTIAIGTYGFIQTLPEEMEWFCFIENIINALKPKIILVYGTLPAFIYDNFKDKTEFIFYDAWMHTRWNEVVFHGN